jgi:lipopolysaccharide export system permease protein
MLSILDKYIIKKFLSTYFFMLGIIMLLSMVFDISANLSEFIQNKAPISAIFIDYYLNFLVYYGNTFSSIIVFISVIWFTAKMAQDSEIIPMLFSGRPFLRILKPYAISATILLVLSIFINHFLLPISNKIRLDFEEKYYRSRMLVENYHAEFNKEKYVYFSTYNSEENLVYNFNLEQWSKNNEPTYFLRAKTAKNFKGTNRWQFTNFYERKIGGTNDVLHVGLKKDTVFNFKIEDLAFRDNRSETMTNSELNAFIDREIAKGSANVPMYKIVLYQRTSLPFAVYVLTLIGVAVSSTKKRGGIGLNIAIGLGFAFTYIFAMKITTVAALNVGFPPLLAVWIPNIIFGVVGIYLYRVSPK